MGYTRKIISLVRIAIADSIIDITEIIEVGTVIGINGNKSTRKVIDISRNFISKVVGKQRQTAIINCATYSFSVSLSYNEPT